MKARTDKASLARQAAYNEKIKEKQRLQKLALEYEERLKKLKVLQRKKMPKKLTPKKRHLSVHILEETPSKSLLQQAKIDLPAVEIIDVTGSEVDGLPRRRSMLETNPRPNLKGAHPTLLNFYILKHFVKDMKRCSRYCSLIMTHKFFFLLTFLIVLWLKDFSFFKELENHFCTFSYLPTKIICLAIQVFL